MTYRAEKLFVGVGNVLRFDDGVGVCAAEIMASIRLPLDVEVYDAGTLGFDVAGILEHRSLVVVVDAIDAKAAPGSVHRFTPEQLLPFVNTGISLHDVHLLDALNETRLLGRAPHRVVVIGIQVADISAGIGLSAPVQRGLEEALHLAVRELGLPGDILKHAAVDTLPWARVPKRSKPWTYQDENSCNPVSAR